MDFHSLVHYISNYKNVLKTNGYYYSNETMKYVYFMQILMQIPRFYANWDQVVFFTVNGKKNSSALNFKVQSCRRGCVSVCLRLRNGTSTSPTYASNDTIALSFSKSFVTVADQVSSIPHRLDSLSNEPLGDPG